MAAHATVNEVILATGPGGKAKGFGFVFIAEKDKGEAVVAAINNTELEGRKIKVDIAKAKGGKGGGRGGNRGGGRVVMVVENPPENSSPSRRGEGGKKRKRRPRPKKD